MKKPRCNVLQYVLQHRNNDGCKERLSLSSAMNFGSISYEGISFHLSVLPIDEIK